jgi:hypothetical protein
VNPDHPGQQTGKEQAEEDQPNLDWKWFPSSKTDEVRTGKAEATSDGRFDRPLHTTQMQNQHWNGGGPVPPGWIRQDIALNANSRHGRSLSCSIVVIA